MSLGGWCWWCLSRFARKKGTTSAPAQLLCLLQAGYHVGYHNLLATTWYHVGYHTLLATTWYHVGYHTLLATTWHNVSYHTLLATTWHNVSYHTLLASTWHNVSRQPPPAPLGRLVSVALWLASLAMSAQHQAPSLPSAPKGGSPKGYAFPPPTFLGSPISHAPRAFGTCRKGYRLRPKNNRYPRLSI